MHFPHKYFLEFCQLMYFEDLSPHRMSRLSINAFMAITQVSVLLVFGCNWVSVIEKFPFPLYTHVGKVINCSAFRHHVKCLLTGAADISPIILLIHLFHSDM